MKKSPAQNQNQYLTCCFHRVAVALLKCKLNDSVYVPAISVSTSPLGVKLRSSAVMAANSPPTQPSFSSKPSNKKRKGKGNRNPQDPELDRLDSLQWHRSLAEDDPFSAFAGSHELEGGSSTLSLSPALCIYIYMDLENLTSLY